MQVVVQRRIITSVLGSDGAPLRVPLALRLLARWPRLRRIPARLIGLGVRPEHIGPPGRGGTAAGVRGPRMPARRR
jgi:hypothetical protein